MDKSEVKIIIEIFVISTIASVILMEIITLPGIKEPFFAIIFPEKPVITFPYNLAGLVIIVLGFVLVIWANFTLLQKISLEEREPFHTPSALVTTGPFQFSRNPVYLSIIMMTFGCAIFLGSLPLFVCPLFLFILFSYFIRWEEKTLEETFGEDYLEFKKRVRRWM